MVERTGLIAIVGFPATTASVFRVVASRLLLSDLTLSGSRSGAVDSLRGGRSRAVRVELWVVACLEALATCLITIRFESEVIWV